jgi:hypothetical protein
MDLSKIFGGIGSALGLQSKPNNGNLEGTATPIANTNQDHSPVARALASTSTPSQETAVSPEQNSILAKLEDLITNQSSSLKALSELKTLITTLFSKKETVSEANPATTAVTQEQADSANELASLEQMLKSFAETQAANANTATVSPNNSATDPLAQLSKLLGATADAPAQQAA